MLPERENDLRFTLNSAGWMEILRTSAARQKLYMAQLLDPTQKRATERPDDYIRGYIAALIWMATWPRQEVEAAEEKERETQVELEQSQKYEHTAQYGHTAGIDSPLLEE